MDDIMIELPGLSMERGTWSSPPHFSRSVSQHFGRGYSRTLLDYPPIRTFWFSGRAGSEGIQTFRVDDTAVRIYGPEKSVADLDALKIVIDERPDIFDHNVETVVRLFKQIQPQDRYEWAMTTLSNAKQLQRPCLCVVSFS
jgi:hypothetical protein